MQTINALDARNLFSETIRRAQRSPVRITRNGKPVAVVMSIEDYEVAEDLKMRFLQESVAQGLDDIKNGRVRDVDSFFDELEAEI